MNYKTKQLEDGNTAYFINGKWYKKASKNKIKKIKANRDCAKGSNYSILYGGGAYATSGPWQKEFPELSKSNLMKKTNLALKGKKGIRCKESDTFINGTDSSAFNYMENIALNQEVPSLPALGTKISTALRPSVLDGKKDFYTGRLNWTIQASGSEFLSIFLTAVHWLMDENNIPFEFIISIN